MSIPLNETKADNDIGTRETKKIETIPDPKVRKTKSWLVLTDMGKLYYGKHSVFEYYTSGSSSRPNYFQYFEAYKLAGEHCLNIELETTSFKRAKQLLIEIAEEIPISKLYLVRNVQLDTVIKPGD